MFPASRRLMWRAYDHTNKPIYQWDEQHHDWQHLDQLWMSTYWSFYTQNPGFRSQVSKRQSSSRQWSNLKISILKCFTQLIFCFLLCSCSVISVNDQCWGRKKGRYFLFNMGSHHSMPFKSVIFETFGNSTGCKVIMYGVLKVSKP